MDKLRFAVRKFDPFERALEKCWVAYQELYPSDMEIEFVPLDLEELTAAFFENQGLHNGDWDIVHINTDWIARAYDTKGLANLDLMLDQYPPEEAECAWSESLQALQRFDGQVFGLPFHDGPECLVFRKDLFDDSQEQSRFHALYGKPLAVPTTWTDFLTVATFFTRPEDNLYGTVFAGYPDGHNAVFDFCIQLWSRGGDLQQGEIPVKLDQPLAVEALDFYRGLFKESRGLHPESANYESVQAGAAFSRGEVAMMVNWFGFASWAQIDAASAVQGKVDVAAIPSAEGGMSPSLNVYWLYAIPEGSRHKQLAYDFIRFAVGRQQDKLLTVEGGVGCRYSTWYDSEINQMIPFYNKLAELHDTARTLPRLANWPQIAHIIDETVIAAINSEESSLSLLTKAQKKTKYMDRIDIQYKTLLPQTSLPIIIIGAGGIVKDAHLPAYRKAGFHVHGIVNRTKAKAEVLAAEFGIPYVYDTVEDAVAHAPENAVYDVTIMPNKFIETLEALPNGAAVLIQKPMGDYYTDSQAILEVCQRKRLVAAINCQLRQAPFVNAARWLIEQGYIGELYDMEVRVSVHTPWQLFPHVMVHPRLEILYHSVHYIDLIRSFLGNPESVYAKTLKHPAKDLSSSRTTLLFDYGDTLHAVVNTNHDHEFGPKHEESYIKWEGTKGAIKATMGLLMDYPHGVSDVFEYCIKPTDGSQPEWVTYPIEGTWFPDAFIGSMGSLMRFKLGEIAVLPAAVEDVIHTMAVVEAAYQSSAQGGQPIAKG